MRSGRGFAMVTALFLLVGIAVVGAFMVSFIGVTSTAEGVSARAVQAYYAARAGIEWGVYQVKAPSVICPASPTHLSVEGMVVSVTCQQTVHNEGGANVYVYELQVAACSEPSAGACPNGAPTLPDYVERRLRAVVDGSGLVLSQEVL